MGKLLHGKLGEIRGRYLSTSSLKHYRTFSIILLWQFQSKTLLKRCRRKNCKF